MFNKEEAILQSCKITKPYKGNLEELPYLLLTFETKRLIILEKVFDLKEHLFQREANIYFTKKIEIEEKGGKVTEKALENYINTDVVVIGIRKNIFNEEQQMLFIEKYILSLMSKKEILLKLIKE